MVKAKTVTLSAVEQMEVEIKFGYAVDKADNPV